MTAILRGDTADAISVAIDPNAAFDFATLTLDYQSVSRTIPCIRPGDVVQLRFTADETRTFALGAFPLAVTLRTPDATLTQSNAALQVLTTDDLSRVRSSAAVVIAADGALRGVEGLPDRYTPNDLRRKLNEVIRRLGGTVAAFALLSLSVFAAVSSAPLGEIPSDANVVTNVTFDGLATTEDLNTVRSEIPSTDGLLSKSEAEDTYAKTGDVVAAKNGFADSLTVTNLTARQEKYSFAFQPKYGRVILDGIHPIWEYFIDLYSSTTNTYENDLNHLILASRKWVQRECPRIALDSVYLGSSSAAPGEFAIAIGKDAKASGKHDIVIGRGAASAKDSLQAILLGNGVSGGANSVVIGSGASAKWNGVVIGQSAKDTHGGAFVFGRNAVSHGFNTINFLGESELSGVSTTNRLQFFYVGDTSLWDLLDAKYAERLAAIESRLSALESAK